ncbi:flagellar type III secretion system pore protein FliP [Desulfotalea psychrophila]|uniref:Flagellar biosynthetic protein FliP n=1 Tax=Desulfotalea psychrophila (strain LSv54 / DSM 12343) TaxID=177439 RepID=Q3V7H6_DESPS|nr:flagellar type III secretion system pore protein FliP [Desulfotalea psychrophila]CAG37400.1 probable flagellar biosynthetic protein (FliP) [Desulfotalea psychrophila LSv54]
MNKTLKSPNSAKSKYLYILFLATISLLTSSHPSWAVGLPNITLGLEDADSPEKVSAALQILFVLTIISVAPAIVLMMTCFTRIVIVLGFVRQAMGTQNMPPNQIVIGFALFLTFFIMSPTINKINDTALQPYLAKEISQGKALDLTVFSMREFMFSQVQESELSFMAELTIEKEPKDKADIPTTTLIPAYMLSELKTAFSMGFMVYIPFLVIDMIVASVLMSMGMMMLPPVIISMPFKLLLFILVDGWTLIVGSLVKSFG